MRLLISRRKIIFLYATVFAWLSGCSDIFNQSPENSNQEETKTEQTNSSVEEQTQKEIQTPEEQNISVDLLQLSDLPKEYELVNNRSIMYDDASEEQKQEFEERGIASTHRRVFLISDNLDWPETIISSITFYRNSELSSEDLESYVNNFRESGASIETNEIEDTLTTTIMKFESDAGNKTTLYTADINEKVVEVATSDPDTHFENKCRELFKTQIGLN